MIDGMMEDIQALTAAANKAAAAAEKESEGVGSPVEERIAAALAASARAAKAMADASTSSSKALDERLERLEKSIASLEEARLQSSEAAERFVSGLNEKSKVLYMEVERAISMAKSDHEDSMLDFEVMSVQQAKRMADAGEEAAKQVEERMASSSDAVEKRLRGLEKTMIRTVAVAGCLLVAAVAAVLAIGWAGALASGGLGQLTQEIVALHGSEAGVAVVAVAALGVALVGGVVGYKIAKRKPY